MTLAIGDHLRIQRDGTLVGPKDEAYHEYVVVGGLKNYGMAGNVISDLRYINNIDSEGKDTVYVDVRLRVVK